MIAPRTVPVHGESPASQRCFIMADARDENGGSHTYGIIFVHDGQEVTTLIPFQRGPVGESGLNGISDEALLSVVLDRLQGFQEGPYRNRYNALAITKIEEAVHWLEARTRDRQLRGVEGTYDLTDKTP